MSKDRIPEQFIARNYKKSGKDFILFTGLLNLGHDEGLKDITTNIEQMPSKDNGMYAVVSASVVTERGSFSGIGDAAPDSVNKMLLPHLLRMAETRAIARALRFATNIGMTCLEELSSDSVMSKGQSNQPAPKKQYTPSASGDSQICTEKQINYIRKLFKDTPMDAGQRQEFVENLIGPVKSLGELSKNQAGKLIETLQGFIEDND